MLKVSVESACGVVTVRCQGALVRGQETALLCAVMQQPGRDIILDFNGVTEIDAAGTGALVSLRAAGIYLKLVGLSLAVRHVLRVTSLESLFEMSESECNEQTLGPRIELELMLRTKTA